VSGFVCAVSVARNSQAELLETQALDSAIAEILKHAWDFSNIAAGNSRNGWGSQVQAEIFKCWKLQESQAQSGI
jgi:hypothetical protein